jgi:hypothetical protein
MRCLTLVLLCVCGIGLGAQVPARVTSPEAQIAAAEKAAASMPGVTANTPPRKCYILKPEQIVLPGASDNPASFDLASGDFVARSVSFGWDKTYEIGKIPLTPRHLDPSVKVRLDLSRLDASAETRAVHFPMVNVEKGGPMFYATASQFPTPGRWMVVATAGANWGCFVFDRPVKATPSRFR